MNVRLAPVGAGRAATLQPVLLWGTLILALTAGCGGNASNGRLTGKVLCGGQLLRSGSLKFVDAANRETNTAISPEGTYRVTRLAHGPCRIAVSSHARTPFGTHPGVPEERPLALP